MIINSFIIILLFVLFYFFHYFDQSETLSFYYRKLIENFWNILEK